MRKISLLSIFVLALSLAIVPFSGSRAQATGGSQTYFGLSAGYSYQNTELEDFDVNIKENAFYFSPKLGFVLDTEDTFSIEVEPRWTIGSAEIEVGSISIDVDDTLHHLLLPVVLVGKVRNESVEFSFGGGAGFNFYDVTDDPDKMINLIGKIGFAVPISEKVKAGVSGQISYSIWEDVDDINVLNISIGPKLEFKF